MTTVGTLEVEVIDKGGLKRDIRFEVPADAVTSALNEACAGIARGLKLPGFRAGKVPHQVVLGRFRGQVVGEVLQRLVPDYYRQALAQADVAPASEPEFGDLDLQEGKPLQVVATVEVEPEITLAPYDGLELTGVDLGVTDEDITVAHRSLQDTMATLEPCEEGHLADTGNQVVIDFEGSVDGKPFEGGKAEGFGLILGEGRFIPGFEEQIAGHAAGDAFDVVVTFPDDYHAEHLRGKEATFAVKLTAVRRKVLPDVDDAFASQVGDFADLEALNRTLREEIHGKRQEDQHRLQRRQALAKLIEANVFDPPEGMVEAELHEILHATQRLILMQGKTPQQAGFDPDKVREENRPEAVNQARGRLIVSRIARTEGIEVAEADLAAEVARLAREYGRPESEIRQRVYGDPEEVGRLRQHLLRNKVLDHVIAHAKVTVTPRSADS
jgi:trigger factor